MWKFSKWWSEVNTNTLPPQSCLWCSRRKESVEVKQVVERYWYKHARYRVVGQLVCYAASAVLPVVF